MGESMHDGNVRHADAFLGFLRSECQRRYELTGIRANRGNDEGDKEGVDGDVAAQVACVIGVRHRAQHVTHGVGKNADDAQTGEQRVKRFEPNLAGSHVLELALWSIIKRVTSAINGRNEVAERGLRGKQRKNAPPPLRFLPHALQALE